MADPHDTPAPLPTTLEELLDAYNDDPEAWYATATVGVAAKQELGSRTWLSSRGPVDLSVIEDATALYSLIADRIEGPLYLVLRARRRPSSTVTVAIDALATEACWRSFRSTPVPPPQAPQAPAAPAVPPPTDLIGLLGSQMHQQGQVLIELMKEIRAPKSDPTVDSLRREIERMQDKEEKSSDKLIDLGKQLAGAASPGASVPWDGVMTMATPVVEGLVGFLKASADSKSERRATQDDIAKAKADKEASEAEAECLRLTLQIQREAQAQAKGGAVTDDVDVKAPT